MLIYSIIIPVKNMFSPSTQIIVKNNLSSTVKIRYNKYSINSTFFPKNIISQLIGQLLREGSIIFFFYKFSLFYMKIGSKSVKIIKDDLLIYLDKIALAY